MNNYTVKYDVAERKSILIAKSYQKTLHSPYRYLAYRDIPGLIKKHVLGKNALDYGCGTGISTRFLKEQGFSVTGIDISEEMLQRAYSYCPSASYYQVENDILSSFSESYDLIFSSFVLSELSNEINEYLRNAKSLLKKGGILIAITSSEYIYSKSWFCFNNNYEENQHIKSGDKGKILAPDVGIEFIDYYWTEQDYLNFLQQLGFTLIETYYPLGKKDEPYAWKDEISYSPFLILVSKLSS